MPRPVITRDLAKIGLCGLPFVRPGQEWLPGYIVYECPTCLGWHTALETAPLMDMLAFFPDARILRNPEQDK